MAICPDGEGERRTQARTRPHRRHAGITEQSFYRWREEYGGMKTERAKRLKELEQENGKLKRLVAELSLDKQIL